MTFTVDKNLQIGGKSVFAPKLELTKEGYAIGQLVELEFLPGDDKDTRKAKRKRGERIKQSRLLFTFECHLEESFDGSFFIETYLRTNTTVDPLKYDFKNTDGSYYKDFSKLTQLYCQLGYADRKVLEKNPEFVIPSQDLNQLANRFFAFKVELAKGRFWNPILPTVRFATSTEIEQVAEYFSEDDQ